MHSLLGDRFLKRFAGDILNKMKHPTSITEGQIPDADNDKVVNSNNNDEEKILEKDAADSRETKQGSNKNNSGVHHE